ncbi:MAG: RagB/SusD family nutrient uptake outer membrane protein [Gemmatimonadaceae bacterium]|nr:RagB/SusD family nutrient uptake outer membrane protein [Gemmatimonadaceae bacterium]
MKFHSQNRRVTLRPIAAALTALSLAACELDISNPNAATEQGVLISVAGLRALAVGMQGRLGNSMEENIYVPGLISGELANTSATQSTQREFQNFPTASANSAIEETNVDLLDIWAKNYGVVKPANDILDNIDNLTFAPGTRAGMVGLAKLCKAMAYGFLIEAFEKISIDGGATFVDRPTALTEILSLLASAKTDVTGTTLTTDFTGSILSPNFDLLNTIRAMQARYSLAAGNYDATLGFANEVPATASSVITFAGADINALRDLFHGSKYFGVISTYRTNAEPGDTRVDKFTRTTAFAPLGGASMFETNIYLTDADPIPVFSQDELSLIRAEALARLNRLPEAIVQINVVRNRAGLPSKTAAGLSTQAAVLEEIFTQRTYSLFAMGLRWADERRFGKIALAKVRYLPYPFTVRATNPGTPANP